MARRAPIFTQAAVSRLIKGAIAAGIPAERIKRAGANQDGLYLIFGDHEPDDADAEAPNEWDEVLTK